MPHQPTYPFRLYSALFGAVVTSLVTMAFLFNALIDPYGMNGLVEVEGVNTVKPRSYTHGRMAKRARAERVVGPRTALLGNSRVDVGFDPLSDLWPERLQPIVNLGIPGDGMDGLLESYAFATRELGVRTVVIGLDFFDFLSDAPATGIALPDPDRFGRATFGNRAAAYLSLTALKDSGRTLLAQGDPYAPTMTSRGFNPMHHYTPIVALEGHAALAAQKIEQNAANYLSRPHTLFAADGSPAAPLVKLKLLLDDAQANGVELVLFTYPYHVQLLDMVRQAGLWPVLQGWKRVLAAHGDRWRSTGRELPIWDFATYSPWTTEPVPAPGDRQATMRWYWEPGHFKSALGEIVIGHMFAGHMFAEGTESAGVRIDRLGIDLLLAEGRRRMLRHYETGSRSVAQLTALAGARVAATPPLDDR